MSIDKEGYLSKDIHEIEARIIQNSENYFRLLKKINKHSHLLKFQLNIHKDNIQQLTAALLFISLNDSLSSIYLLTSKGLLSDSNVILRSMLEKTIKLKYICKTYENAWEYIYRSETNRLKLMNVILNNPEVFSEEVKKGISNLMRDQLKKEIEEKGIPKEKRIEELAKQTNMEIYYHNVYRITSSDVHSDFKSIEKKMFFNEENEVVSINWMSLPDNITQDVEATLFTAISLVCHGIETINDLFEINDKTIVEFVKEVDTLRPKY